MKIKEVAIENFKCFKEATFQLGKLTLLTGINSSGKSSVLYSIPGALQSGEFPFQFSPNGKYIDMGNFEEISHLKDLHGDREIYLFATGSDNDYYRLPSSSFTLELCLSPIRPEDPDANSQTW